MNQERKNIIREAVKLHLMEYTTIVSLNNAEAERLAAGIATTVEYALSRTEREDVQH